MMAASSGITGASAGRPSSSRASSSFPSTSDPNHNSNDAVDDEFSSFAAAERLSDPFGDVYGAEADFGDFEQSDGPSLPPDSSSLMSFSPTAPPTLLPSISGEVDPFADITGGLGAAVDSADTIEQKKETVEKVGGNTTAILDLVWGNTEINPSTSRTASNPSGFTLPPPPPTKFATFPSTSATITPEASTGDLLSFSPVQASTPSDPFFGISNDTSETNAAATTFGNDELFTLTATPPLSTTSSSASTSLRGSFASLHEELKPPMLSPSTPGSVKESPRDIFAERTTRSFGSLSSSFVSVGAMEDNTGQKGASFGAFASAAPEAATSVTPSPSSAPPSLRSSLKMTDGFVGFTTAADELDEVDPFAEAGLAAPEEVPLAEALAAWSTAAGSVGETEEGCGQEEKEVTSAVQQDNSQSVSSDDLASAVTVGDTSAGFDTSSETKSASTEEESLDDWQNAGTPTTTTFAADHVVDNPFDTAFSQELQTVPVVDSPSALKSERPSFMTFDEATAVAATTDDGENVTAPITDENDDEVHGLSLQDNASEEDECESDEDDAAMVSCDEVVWPAEQPTTEGPFETSQVDPFIFSTPAPDLNFESADIASVNVSEDFALHHDLSSESPSVPDAAPTVFPVELNSCNAVTAAEETKGETQEEDVGGDDGAGFGDFGGFETAAPPTASAAIIPDASPWGSFPSPTPIEDEHDSFRDFAGTVPEPYVPGAADKDDGFADFGQSTEPSGDDDFGDFTQSSGNDAGDFSDFQQSDSHAFGKDDDTFGDFAPAVASTPETTTSELSAPSFTKTELTSFFEEAFVTEPVPTNTLEEPDSPTDEKDADVGQESSTEVVQDVFRSMWDEYITIVAATGHQSSSSSGSLASAPEPTDNGKRVRLGRKTTRASKYLKYVLSEKIQEASRQDGIFPHGSERHQMYVEYAASGDAERMQAALKELQDALFHNSVNDAMMRIAKQAALSAKAKIAEQAAQQQASSRGGSLFSTTRHLLSRGGNAAGADGPGSSNDNKGDHAGADTPTGASVQKLARFSFANSHDDSANGHRGANSADERGSEGSDHTGHSSGSDSEVAPSSGDSRTRSQTSLSNSGSSNGGLMRKFQDRFSFASSRHRPRFVSLRRKGQSGEDVRKMELNLDAISGGLDEVKWKCAMFLYDVEEVAHVAPSQISILSYPSKQPLAGKTDRSALTKLVKPDTIWTVDIGANNSDMLNEW